MGTEKVPLSHGAWRPKTEMHTALHGVLGCTHTHTHTHTHTRTRGGGGGGGEEWIWPMSEQRKFHCFEAQEQKDHTHTHACARARKHTQRKIPYVDIPQKLLFFVSNSYANIPPPTIFLNYNPCVSKCSLYVFTIIPPRLSDPCNFITVLLVTREPEQTL